VRFVVFGIYKILGEKVSFTFHKLSGSYFWYFAILGLIVPFLSVFLDHRGFNSIEIGEILAIFTATKIIGPAMWAIIADKRGEQLSIIRFGALLTFFSFCLMFFADGYWPIVFVLAIFSIFWTAILPQMEVLTLYSIRKSAKIYARIRLWGSIGFIVLSIVSGELLSRYTPEAFTYIGAFVLLMLYVSTLFIKQPKIGQLENTDSQPIISKCLELSFIAFFIAGLFLQLSFGPYYSFFALYLRDLDYPSFAVGAYASVGVVAEIVIFLIAGSLFKHYSMKGLLIFSLLLTAIRWYLMADYADSAVVLFIAQVLHAFSFGLYHAVSIQFVQRHFSNQQQNRGQAIYLAGVYGIGGAIGAYASGILWQDGKGAELSFELAALMALLGMLCCFLIKEKKEVY